MLSTDISALPRITRRLDQSSSSCSLSVLPAAPCTSSPIVPLTTSDEPLEPQGHERSHPSPDRHPWLGYEQSSSWSLSQWVGWIKLHPPMSAHSLGVRRRLKG